MSSSFGKNEVMFRRRGLSSNSHKFVVVAVVMVVPTAAVTSGADGTGTTFGRLGDRVVSSLSISYSFLISCLAAAAVSSAFNPFGDDAIFGRFGRDGRMVLSLFILNSFTPVLFFVAV